jgi:hypothetical protein
VKATVGRRSLALAVALLVAAVAPASPHQVNLSSAAIMVGADRTIDVQVSIKGSDVDRLVGTHIVDAGTGMVRPEALTAATTAIASYVAAHARIANVAGQRCRSGPADVSPDSDGVLVRVRSFCGMIGDPLVYQSHVLTDIDPAAQQVVLITGEGGPAQALLDATETTVRLTGASEQSVIRTIAIYFAIGTCMTLAGLWVFQRRRQPRVPVTLRHRRPVR